LDVSSDFLGVADIGAYCYLRGVAVLNYLFFTLAGGMVGIWFLLVVLVCRRLKKLHAVIYEQLGAPTLFWNNSMRNNFLFTKFLFTRRYARLNDAVLKHIMDFMLFLFILYSVLFFSTLLMVILGWVK
jgi:hypothetical protein